ncbi:MAG TPA: tetratricopeptide repeat protein, partial [Polyangiaceae bacterium]|nr:tetratricopeptide repeat protein [Polyangiaceae bacterium]
ALAKGDFEGAHAELAKASVLVEGDPRVASELGRVEVARVELLWAQQRLNAALDAAKAEAAAHAPQRRRKTEAEQAAEALAANQDASEKKLLEQSFQERLGKAKAAVAEAVRLAPTSVDVVRSQVDLLRLSGELPRARTMVSALSAQASDPDNAYSLGALDLAEGPAGYPSAIERLRVAARAEEALGRARPLLIYALTQTDPAAASAELDKLQTVAPTHRALPALRTLVEFASAKQAAAEPEPAPRKPASAALAASPKPPASTDPVKSTLAKANEAFAQGDLDSAESLYRSSLQRSPGNVAALSGLGDIARQRQQNATAGAYYDQILKQDRNHLPTLMSRGDMYWESGNRILAVALYRRAITQVGSDDPRVQRAWQRIEEFEREVGAVPKASEPAPSTAPAPSEPSPSEPAPSEPAPSEPAPSEPAPSGLGPSDEAPAAESPAGTPTSPAPPKSGTPVPEPPSDPAPNPSGRQPAPSGDIAAPPGAPAATP